MLELICGDSREVLKDLPAQSVQCVVTSPPYYGLRDYGVEGQIGLEQSPTEYVEQLVSVFREVQRVLRDDGTVFLNLGDSYASNPASGGSASSGLNAKRNEDGTLHKDNKSQGITPASTYKRPIGLKPKDLIGIPWMVAFALRDDGWYLRSDIIWHKPNPMPESVTDRPTKAHEYLFLLTKQARYYYDAEAVKEKSIEPVRKREKNNGESSVDTKLRGHDCNCDNSGRRNRRSVWTVATQPYSEAHFATYPPKLIEPCILAGSKPGDTVLDPFNGAGTTGLVALKFNRRYIGIDLNPDYLELTRKRLNGLQPVLTA